MRGKFQKLAILCLAFWPLITFAGNGINGGLPDFDIDTWKSMRSGPTQLGAHVQRNIEEAHIDCNKKIKDKYRKCRLEVGAFEGLVKLKIRGSSSRGFDKKQYAMKLDSAESILGLRSATKFVLSAPYSDKTLIRNILAYRLFENMGHWSPGTRLLNVFLRVGDGSYKPQGIYVLTEKVDLESGKIHSSRDTVLLNIDRVKDGDEFVTLEGGLKVLFDDPSEPEEAQKEMIKDKLNRIQSALDSRGSAGYSSLFERDIDLRSAVDFLIIQELSRNVDGYWLSSPMYIPPGGKLTFGPLWDFNLAFGNADYANGWKSSGFRAEEKGVWFKDFLKHPSFCSELKTRWRELRHGVLSNNSIFGLIDRQVDIMEDAIDDNFDIWDNLGKYQWPNPYYKLSSHDDEIKLLKTWIAMRGAWMDSHLASGSCH